MSSNSIEFYLLAAGKGERLGGSKPLLSFGRTTVFERMVSTIREAGIASVRVIGTRDNADLAKLAFDMGVRYIFNLEPERGMSGSIVEALSDCTSDWLALCPSDMPLLSPEAIRACVEQLRGTAVQPICEGRRKHPVFVNSACLFEVRTALANGTLRDFLANRTVHEIACEPCWQFEDIDTPEDYHKLLSLAGFNPN